MRPALTELRLRRAARPLTERWLRRAARPLTERWRQLPVPPRGSARLGISFRPLQAAALGLDPEEALRALLAYPFQLIRLGAYWNRLEPRPGDFRPGRAAAMVAYQGPGRFAGGGAAPGRHCRH